MLFPFCLSVLGGVAVILGLLTVSLGATWEKGMHRKVDVRREDGILKCAPGLRFRAGAGFLALAFVLLFWLSLPTFGAAWFLGPLGLFLAPGPGGALFYPWSIVLMIGQPGPGGCVWA